LQGTLFDSRDLPACFAADAHRSIPPTVEWQISYRNH